MQQVILKRGLSLFISFVLSGLVLFSTSNASAKKRKLTYVEVVKRVDANQKRRAHTIVSASTKAKTVGKLVETLENNLSEKNKGLVLRRLSGASDEPIQIKKTGPQKLIITAGTKTATLEILPYKYASRASFAIEVNKKKIEITHKDDFDSVSKKVEAAMPTLKKAAVDPFISRAYASQEGRLSQVVAMTAEASDDELEKDIELQNNLFIQDNNVCENKNCGKKGCAELINFTAQSLSKVQPYTSDHPGLRESFKEAVSCLNEMISTLPSDELPKLSRDTQKYIQSTSRDAGLPQEQNL